jgi:putative transposase
MVIALLAHKAHVADAADTSTLGDSLARGLTLNSRITARKKRHKKDCHFEQLSLFLARYLSSLSMMQGLALSRPKLSAAAVHRKTVEAAMKLDVNPPSYDVVYSLIRKLAPALVTMAHEGMKSYSESFDLVHRVESEAPNAIWQADHTELDILVKDERGNAGKPWLTIILDDYSRAVAGYMLSFEGPSAIQTALALRQAIWRKPQAGWHICGIPEVLYN